MLRKLIIVIIVILGATDITAQKFSVESFRVLPNDVTAFIDPVEDLNGDRCALIKVVAEPDFVFSTPLGIVKRIDKTGEIWIYLPKGSKKITLKHPEWGVMRDFQFPEKLVSQQSYELRLSTPERHNRADVTPPAVTVRDTLLIVKTDTLMIERRKPGVPFAADVIATAGFGNIPGVTAGILLTAMKRAGGFVHVQSNMRKSGPTKATCDKEGNIGGATPYYSGKTRHSVFMATAGVIERISEHVSIFEGIGYGDITTAWQLAASEGGGYVKNTHYSCAGIAFESGAIYRLGRVSVGASVTTVKGKKWTGSIGVGINIGKSTRKSAAGL